MARLFSLATAWMSQAPSAVATAVLSLSVAGAALSFALFLQLAGLALIGSGAVRVVLSVVLTVLFVVPPLCFFLVSFVQRSARAEADAAEKTDFLAAVLANTDEGVAVFDGSWQLAAWSDGFERVLKLPPGWTDTDRSLEEVVRHRAERDEYGDAELDEMTLARQACETAEQTVQRTIIADRPVELRATAAPAGVVATYIAETERKSAPAVESAAPEELADALEHVPEGLAIWSSDDRLVMCNSQYRKIHAALGDVLAPGVTYTEFVRASVATGLYGADGTSMDRIVHEKLREHRERPGDLESSFGDDRWMQVGRRMTDDGRAIDIWTDITDRKKAEAAIERLALSDTLTGLANRTLFLRRLDEAVEAAQRLGRMVAVLFLDLDQFEPINVTYGHDKGDDILKVVSGRLQRCTRKVDTVARLSGDEFAIILTNLEGTDAINVPVKRILRALSEVVSIDGQEISAACSIGVSFFPTDDKAPMELVRKADVALHQAKAAGGRTYRLYDKTMDEKAQFIRLLVEEMRHALRDDQFQVYYQPQLDITGNRLVGAEALIRWNHPTRGFVMPDDFIPAAESSGMIVPIGNWVLGAACKQALQWQSMGMPPFRIAVNISPRQFQADSLIPTVRTILEKTGLNPNCLELEISEGMMMGEGDHVIEKLRSLNDLGISLAIDDFGTGYSSLAYLKRFPVHRLKVDRSFVRDLTTDPDDAAITEAVIRLGHSLGLTVTAEGVETDGHMSHLRTKSCDEVQGFLFSKPLPADEFFAWATAPGRSVAPLQPVGGSVRRVEAAKPRIAKDGRDKRAV